MAKPLKSILEQYVGEARFKTGAEFNAAHKKIEAAGFVKSRKHSIPGMNYYGHPSGHTIGLTNLQDASPEIEAAHMTNGAVKYSNVEHKDLDSHLKKVTSLKEDISEEMTDDEIDAHNDSFEDKVAAAHDKHITKKFGKNADVNWGAVHNEDGEHGQFASKVYHPKHGMIYVTTHYNTKTHEVLRHEED